MGVVSAGSVFILYCQVQTTILKRVKKIIIILPHSFVPSSQHKEAAVTDSGNCRSSSGAFPLGNLPMTWADYQDQVQNSDPQATIRDGTIPSGSKARPKCMQIPGSEDLWKTTDSKTK